MEMSNQSSHRQAHFEVSSGSACLQLPARAAQQSHQGFVCLTGQLSFELTAAVITAVITGAKPTQSCFPQRPVMAKESTEQAALPPEVFYTANKLGERFPPVL